MPRTPEQEEELRLINEELARIDEEKKGSKAVATYQAAKVPAAPQASRPFSLYRTLVGGARDAIQGPEDVLSGIFSANRAATGAPEGWSVSGVISDLYSLTGGGQVAGLYRGITSKDKGTVSPLSFTIPQLEGSDQAGGLEKFARGVVSFAIPFGAASKVVRGLGGASFLASAGRGALAGAMVDFAQVDPVSGNMATVLKEAFGLNNAALNALAAEPDDTDFELRLKAAAAGAPVGVAGDALFAAGGKLLRLYRGWKGTTEEAAAVVENLRSKPVQLDDSVPRLRKTDTAGTSGADNAAAGDIPKVEPDAVYDPVAGLKERNPEDFEDILDFLKRKSGVDGADPVWLSRLGKALYDGDPENALKNLGLDPAKLDFSVFDDPARMARLQDGLASLYETVATGLGRSNVRVTEKAVVRGAEALASTPDVLKSLYGSTNKLAEQLMGARLFVGAHSHKLLALAETAIEEISKGPPGAAWLEFLDAFHRHAYFLGTLRGAGTEVGRALRSLQMIAKVNPKQAAAALDEAVAEEAAGQAPKAGKWSVPQGASAFADSLVTDAEKLGALKRLVDLRGDVSELTRFVREGSGSTWARVSAAVKETMGSLFSTATAVYNVGSGVTVMATDLLGRWLAAGLRAPGLLVGGRANAEARRAIFAAWGETEGILGGFKEAYRNTLAVLEHEAYSELALNLDGMGLSKLAKTAASKSAKDIADASVRFERADVVNNKAFALTAAENQKLRKIAESLGGGKFFQASVGGLVRLLGASINAAGTAYRAGTTLFVNLPDEFIGTLASRAGAYKKAVQIASKEAHDLGLEGKEISQYLKARTIQLFGDGPRGISADPFADGAQTAVFRAGETEARRVLFQDDLEWGSSKWIANAVNKTGGLGSIIIPFIKTPMRIIERTAIDYTPLGLLKDRVRKAVLEGGSARDEALARMGLAMTALVTSYQLAADRTTVGSDGGFLSTARDAGRPSYSIRVGDDIYEFSRLDPLGTLMGFGADLAVAEQATEDDPNAGSVLGETFEAMFWATTANVLSKSWLTSIRNLADLSGATSEEDFSTRARKYLTSLAPRLIPGSGIQRQLEAWGDGQVRDAQTFYEGLLRGSIGADKLPPKRDIVGRPSEGYDMAAAGLRGGFRPDPNTDPLGAELEALSFRRPSADRKQKGVPLTTAQFSRFLELRGQVVRDPRTGLTMEEALNTLVRMPEYQALPSKAARIKEIQKVMDGYTPLAVEALTSEDKKYALARLRVEVYDQGELQGWDRPQKDAALQQFAKELGIPTE